MAAPSTQHAVMASYLAAVDSGALDHDRAQILAVKKLDSILDKILEHRKKRTSLIAKVVALRTPTKLPGLYIYGDVGRGKTMLMQLFYEAAGDIPKSRVHFLEFMVEVHAAIHQHRQDFKAGKTKEEDPIRPVAAKISRDARILCFDEFHVRDIADAMILGRLFEKLFANGTLIIATSNVAPNDLYHNGLNRQLFLPFIALLQEHMEPFHLDAHLDFRLEKLSGSPVHIIASADKADTQLNDIWQHLTGQQDGHGEELNVLGRKLRVPIAANGAARFTFGELCDAPLGASDFLKIAHAYHTLFIDHIPQLGKEASNQSKRLILLIDTLYENNVKLIASFDVPIDQINKDPNTEFEFARARSRLHEMASEEYLARPHGTLEQA